MPQYLLLTGELCADKESSVAMNASGIVVSASIERGTFVAKGDILIKLDDREAKLDVQEAEANVASAKAELEYTEKDFSRNDQLAKRSAVSTSTLQKSKSDYDMKAASLLVAEAKLDKCKKKLNDCIVSAPFGGYVAERKVQIGEYVQANTVVAKMVKVDVLRLVLNVSETALGDIHMGQSALFSVASYPEETFAGKVKHVGSEVRDSSRDLVIEAEFDNGAGRLMPGMFVSAKLALKPASKPVAPESAFVRGKEDIRAFIVQNGVAVERCVELGASLGQCSEVRAGLKAGEKVIVNPGAKLKDGTPVSVN